jgi:hypothetical protein
LRQVKGRPQTAQVFVGNVDFFFAFTEMRCRPRRFRRPPWWVEQAKQEEPCARERLGSTESQLDACVEGGSGSSQEASEEASEEVSEEACQLRAAGGVSGACTGSTTVSAS